MTYGIKNHNRYRKVKEISCASQKPLSGRDLNEIDQPHVWLSKTGLYPETEGFVCSFLEQVWNTKVIKSVSLNISQPKTTHAGYVTEKSKTFQHITAPCTQLSQRGCKHRNDQVAQIIHQNVASKHKLIATMFHNINIHQI